MKLSEEAKEKGTKKSSKKRKPLTEDEIQRSYQAVELVPAYNYYVFYREFTKNQQSDKRSRFEDETHEKSRDFLEEYARKNEQYLNVVLFAVSFY